MQSDLVRIFRNLISSQQLPLQLQRRPGPWLTPCCTSKWEQNPRACLTGPRHLWRPMTSSPCPTGWPLAHKPGAKRGSIPPSMPSEPAIMPMKDILKSQRSPFSFVYTTSTAFPLYCQVPCELLIRAAGSEMSLLRRETQGRGRGKGMCPLRSQEG